MSDLETVLTAMRAAVDRMVVAADARGSVWTTPRATGKWSPSQLIEHVARSIEESANEIERKPTKFPHLPFFVKPVARRLLFNRVLRSGAFPKARTNRAFDPMQGPATPAEGRQRIGTALARFEQACREQAPNPVDSVVFGRVTLTDYVRFQEIHTRHHTNQLEAQAPQVRHLTRA
jgi:hypothetical protein